MNNTLIIERAIPGDVAAGVGIKRLAYCDYKFVPSLTDIILPTVIVKMRENDRIKVVGHKIFSFGEEVTYYANTTDWNTENTWLVYWAKNRNGTRSITFPANINEIVEITVIAWYRHEDGTVHEVARRTLSVKVIDEIYTIEIKTHPDGTQDYEYFGALEGLTPEEVREVPFFRGFTDNIVRLSTDGTEEYELNRYSLATNFPLGSSPYASIVAFPVATSEWILSEFGKMAMDALINTSLVELINPIIDIIIV